MLTTQYLLSGQARFLCEEIILFLISMIPKLFTSSLCLNHTVVDCLKSKFRQMCYATIEKKIGVNGININYVKVGSGPHPVVCLPGALGSVWTDFSAQIAGFNLEKHTLVAWDPPGYGLSRPPDRDFSPGHLSRDADIVAELMKTINIPSYSVLGWSDGGITGLFLAARYPQNVKKLVIWGVNAYITEDDLASYERVRDTSNWSQSMRSTLEKIYGAEKLKSMMNEWVDSTVDIFRHHGGNLCKDIIPQVHTPTFILHGMKDPLVPYFHVEYLKQNIRNSRLHVFDEGKHNIHIKFAEEFDKLVHQFLEEQEES